jgi:ABC-type enterobactin transport system permease subunit
MGFKIGSTAIIWGFSTGMLAICIPLVSMTESGVILPLAVIVGATISTVFVWLSSSKPSRIFDKNS